MVKSLLLNFILLSQSNWHVANVSRTLFGIYESSTNHVHLTSLSYKPLFFVFNLYLSVSLV